MYDTGSMAGLEGQKMLASAAFMSTGEWVGGGWGVSRWGTRWGQGRGVGCKCMLAGNNPVWLNTPLLSILRLSNNNVLFTIDRCPPPPSPCACTGTLVCVPYVSMLALVADKGQVAREGGAGWVV